MSRILGEACYLFAVGWFLAQLEIQIEGEHGWAAKLPTWKIVHPWVLKLSNGKPMTGYHVYMTALLLSLCHLPLWFAPFSRPVEAQILSFYFLLTITWDFQWFVWNPVWGTRRFFKDHIWWFPRKLLGLPLEYYGGTGSSFLATALIWRAGLPQWFALFACVTALSVGSAAIAGSGTLGSKT